MRPPAGARRRTVQAVLVGLVVLLPAGCDVGPEDAPQPLPAVPSPVGDRPSPSPATSR